ncbi:MAG: hypothetical protein KAY32_16515 [Candidatus Eisenbacteria sp.]|nr:hypothetical protein [Candidatus Eisenbacteria bacterium]
MRFSRLTGLDFQLAYLVLLTRSGLKPLSRWEGALTEAQCDLIRSGGLVLDTVDRRTRIGRKRIETVFARDQRRTGFYQKRFDGTRLRHTPDVVRLEGRLFGYPSCCIETFIRHPYTPNDIDPDDQRILFHWACPGCLTTPDLLREYRRLYAECLHLFGDPTEEPRRRSLGWAGTAATFAASLALVAGTAGLASAEDSHWLSVEDDQDQDYISVAEEIIRGTNWELPDSDGNLILDGVQTAYSLKQLIASPPPGVDVTDYLQFGLETCNICEETVNMGFVRITHAQRGLSIDLPYIALHYLEHGSLWFDGSIHSGRADLKALKEILFPCDPPHLLPSGGTDPDEDGLLSEEEPLLETDPAIPDTDGDSLIDGPQVAEGLLALISQLPREQMPDQPYMLEYWADGNEQCEICGTTLNMGVAEIVNPHEGLSVSVPFVALHTIAHGGFTFDGTENGGRIIPTVLQTVLTGDGTAHWMPVAEDTDGDGLTDEEEPYFGLDPEDPDQDENGTPDGRELATHLASLLHELPEGPQPDQTYVVHHPAYGHYNCVTCGELINMGFLEIIDPVAELSVNVSYYNLHFMDLGGFSTDRDDLYPRVDPREIAAVLGIQSASVGPARESTPFALWNAPNPFVTSGATSIVLSLPGATGRVDVAVYDHTGRRVRDLYEGDAPQRVKRFLWDGRDNDGQVAAAGIYLCKVRIGSMTVTRKMTLID